MRTAWRVLRLALVSYLLVLLLLMIFEERLIFFPAKYPNGYWSPLPSGVEDAEFEAADGTRLHGWYAPHDNPRAVVLFAHGNAGNLTHRGDVMQFLHAHLRVSVLMFDYRGYGKSEGSPDEAGVIADARAARAWLAEREGIREDEVVLMGRSLGSGVVVDLAAKDGARGLILQSAFTSLPDVAAHHYPWAPVRLLMRTRLNSLEKIVNYSGPVLASHGDTDTIIPLQIGRALYDAVPDPDKQWFTIPNAGHNDMQPMGYYAELERFLDRLDLDTR